MSASGPASPPSGPWFGRRRFGRRATVLLWALRIEVVVIVLLTIYLFARGIG